MCFVVSAFNRSHRGSWSRSITRSSLAFLIVGLLTGLIVTGPGMARAADAATELEVSTPMGLVAGEPSTFVVAITADQATTGSIDVSFEGNEFYSQAVEIPGGSTKEFVIVTSTPPWGGQAVVSFEPDSGSRKVARMNIDDGNSDRVAVFPDLVTQAMPASIETIDADRRASLLAFDPSLLVRGSDVLATVNTGMMSATDASLLDDRQSAALLAWISDGGALLFDGEWSELPSGFVEPGSLSGDATSTWLGQGSIRRTEGALASGEFDVGVVPRQGFDEFGGGFGGNQGSTVRSLAADSGISILDIGPIVIFLLIYILLVGPGLWILLRSMNRAPLFWLLVPLLALGVTGGIWLVGRATQSGASGSFAALIADNGPVRTTTAETLLYSQSGGYVGLSLVDGWEPAARVVDPWNDFGGGAQTVGRPERRGDRYGLDVPPAGVAVISTTRRSVVPAGQDASWEIEITGATETTLAGRVTNRSGYDLSGVVVGIGDGAVPLDDVEADASTSFELNLIDRQEGFDENPAEDGIIRRLRTMERTDPVNAGLYQVWRSKVDLASSSLVVVGWAADVPIGVETIDGVSVEKGRTGFLSTISVQASPSGAGLAAFPGRRFLVERRWAGEGGQGLLIDLPGVAEMVLGPAGDGHPGTSADPIDGGDTASADANSDVVQGSEEEEFEDAMAMEAEMLDGPDGERFAASYLFELFAELEDGRQLALDLEGISGLDYWDGVDWAPSGVGETSGSMSAISWAVPQSAINDGVVLVRLSESWGAASPRLTIPAASDELAWTVGG